MNLFKKHFKAISPAHIKAINYYRETVWEKKRMGIIMDNIWLFLNT